MDGEAIDWLRGDGRSGIVRILVKSGDVLDEDVDVLICTANPMLNMTGGVNGALLQRGGADVQQELRDYLDLVGGKRRWVEAGTVVRTGPGPLAVRHVLHAVSVDGFYKSSKELVTRILRKALRMAGRLGARTVSVPALACGYGPLSVRDFACALLPLRVESFAPVEELRVVLRKERDAERVRQVFDARKGPGAAAEGAGAGARTVYWPV